MGTKLLFVLFALAGCGSGPCVRNSDCAAGDTCSVAGVCVVQTTAPDAGGDGGGATDDAGTSDAATDGGS